MGIDMGPCRKPFLPISEEGKKAIGDLAKTEEDVLSYIAFPQQAEAFLTERKAREERKVSYTITPIED